MPCHALVGKQYDEAIVAYRKVIELGSPMAASAHHSIGIILSNAKKQREAAIVAFRESIKLDPELGKAPCHLGVTLNAMGRTNEAVVAFRKASKLNPKDKDEEAFSKLGNLLVTNGQFDEAIALIRKFGDTLPGGAGSVPASLG